MRLYFSISAFAWMTACGSTHETAAEAIDFVHWSFRTDARACGLQLAPSSTGFIGVEEDPRDWSSDEPVLGYCWPVNPVTGWGWYVGLRADEVDGVLLTPVIYHELGHCLLGLPHAPEGTRSVMVPAIGAEIVNDWAYLRWEIFRRAGAERTRCHE